MPRKIICVFALIVLSTIAQASHKLSFTQEEVKNLSSALNLTSGGGVIVGTTNEEYLKNKDHKPCITLTHYRDIKKDMRTYPGNNQEISQLIQDYPKNIMTNALLKKTMAEFSTVEEQRSWIKWFEKNNTVSIEIMFDYLSSLDEDTLKKVLSKDLGIISRVKQMHIERIVTLYKSTPLYNGIDHKKHFPKPVIPDLVL